MLLTKLVAYGLSKDDLSLTRSYFSDRKNRTKLDHITSRWEEVRRGCPQGSSLGPLLWNVYQVLMSLRKLIPVKAKLRIYKAANLPYLTFWGLTWHFCKK